MTIERKFFAGRAGQEGRDFFFDDEFFEVMQKLHDNPEDREARKNLAEYIEEYREILSWSEEDKHRFSIEVQHATCIIEGVLTKKGVSVYEFFDVMVKKYSTQETESLVNEAFKRGYSHAS